MVNVGGDIITDAAGSAYAEASSIWANSVGSSYVLNRSLGYMLYKNGGAANTIRVYEGTNQTARTSAPSYQNRPAPLASTWGDNLTVYKDGGASPLVAYDGTMGTGVLNITANWNGTVREVKIFDSELTAEEIGDL